MSNTMTLQSKGSSLQDVAKPRRGFPAWHSLPLLLPDTDSAGQDTAHQVIVGSTNCQLLVKDKLP